MLTAILHEDMEDEAALQAYGEACVELGQARTRLVAPLAPPRRPSPPLAAPRSLRLVTSRHREYQ